jgi:hypothetical protein
MSNKKIKNRPMVESKKATKPPLPSFMSQSLFDIDPELRKELEEQGLEGRFVNVGQMQEFGGRHAKGWVPYKRKSLTTEESIFGKDPDGYIRRGKDLVFAVKTKEEAERHRAYLDYNAKEAQVDKKKTKHKKMLEDYVRDNKMNDYLRVTEGYED